MKEVYFGNKLKKLETIVISDEVDFRKNNASMGKVVTSQ